MSAPVKIKIMKFKRNIFHGYFLPIFYPINEQKVNYRRYAMDTICSEYTPGAKAMGSNNWYNLLLVIIS